MRILTENEFRTKYLDEIRKRSTLQFDEIVESVKSIISSVKERGNAAVQEFTLKFDNVEIHDLKVSREEIQQAYETVDDDFINAIKMAGTNIKKFHEAQMPKELCVETQEGVQVTRIIRPIESVGLYVPGGRASYPSSVLMVAIPALVAKVPTRILCTPPSKNGIDPRVLVAAAESKVTEIFKVGGVQAIAALAHGTESIPKVQKIVGPGNKFVTVAKTLLQSEVGIDLPAGPSEILILADESSNSNFIALDLLSQAEHDPNAMCFLISTSDKVAASTIQVLENRFDQFERKEIIQEVLENNLFIITTKNIESAVQLTNEIAPEHLEIQTGEPESILPKIKNAGAIFLGPFSPVAVGDYSAGSNHVLPTGGTARFFSGLNVFDFLKQIEVVKCTKEGLKKLEKTTVTIAEKEGLTAHARSVTERFMK